MPIHEFKCTKCGNDFEELVRTKGQRIACPKCGSAKIDRKLSVFGAVVSKSSSPSCDREACPQALQCPGGPCNFAN
ncbi:MAG: zinc ribbon domain-containing protein [Anaerolineaceae bacterium]|nr:zinc ribbon domain-containing protein [Anaerolineaceae bacterium]